MRDILFSYWGYGKFFIAILCLWLCFAQGACSYFYSLVSLLIFNLIHMQHQVWHVWARLWSGQSTDVVWPRRVPLSSLDRQRAVSATRGVALHHPISLVLSLAHWGRLRPSLQRQGQEHAQVDQRIQISSPPPPLSSFFSLSPSLTYILFLLLVVNLTFTRRLMTSQNLKISWTTTKSLSTNTFQVYSTGKTNNILLYNT